MPFVEVIHASQEAPSKAQKQAFAREVVAIFRDVLGTPDGRLLLTFYNLDEEDSLAGLLKDDPPLDETASG